MGSRLMAAVVFFLIPWGGFSSAPSIEMASIGHFTGTLQLQPLPDGMHMLVVKTYSYSDNEGRTLTAQSGFVTDGASIPRALWTLVGSPFTGKYVGAAIIHDVGCVNHKYPWQVTHRIFYEAMLALGVSESYAKLLYWAVRLEGPRWEEQEMAASSLKTLKERIDASNGEQTSATTIDNAGGGSKEKVFKAIVAVPLAPGQPLTDSEAQDINRYIEARRLSADGPVSLDEIDSMTPMAGLAKERNTRIPKVD